MALIRQEVAKHATFKVNVHVTIKTDTLGCHDRKGFDNPLKGLKEMTNVSILCGNVKLLAET